MTLLVAFVIAASCAIPAVWWPSRNLSSESPNGTPVSSRVRATSYVGLRRQRLASAN
jgi:hypothetical protein